MIDNKTMTDMNFVTMICECHMEGHVFRIPQAKEIRAQTIEECAKTAENWRCNKNDKCYPCDCGGKVPQEAIPPVIRALASKGEAK